MRKVFSSNEVGEAALIRDALVHHGIDVTIQNEHSGGSAVPAFRPPAEVWVMRDDAYEDARRIVIDTISKLEGKADLEPWACANCGEENPQSFDMCWSCGLDKGRA